MSFEIVPRVDLKDIISKSEAFLNKLTGSRILIAGGTGFVGRWLTSSLLEASSRFDIRVKLLVRNYEKARDLFSMFSQENLEIYSLDQNLQIGEVSHIIHAATSSAPSTGGNDKQATYRNAMDIGSILFEIAKNQSKPTFMHLSSGAVYGPKPLMNIHIAESEKIAQNASDSYMRAKMELEIQTFEADALGWIQGTNPRLFAFAGPGIATDAHFAVGHFVEQARSGNEIYLLGNPETTRSYLHPVDMTVWLLAALANPSLEPTHIGSHVGYTMSEIATIVASEFNVKVNVAGNSSIPANYYVPETKNTQNRLNVFQSIELAEAIRRWKNWLKS